MWPYSTSTQRTQRDLSLVGGIRGQGDDRSPMSGQSAASLWFRFAAHRKWPVSTTNRALVAIALLLLLLPAASSAAEGNRRPKFSTIREVVYRHFATEGVGRQEIITQSETKPLFKLLNQMGWNVPGRKQLLERVPADRSLLVRQLRTKSGRKLMQKIAQYPEGYDRLDRLSRMPQGRNILVALVRGPDGYKMIEYLTTSSGGAEMGKILSRIKNNKHFNKPTGRIYTPEHLVKALRQIYDETDPAIMP